MEPVKQKAYRKAFDMACAQLASLSIEDQTVKSGTVLAMKGDRSVIEIPFFDEVLSITIPGFAFSSSMNRNVTLVTKIVALHYLSHASGAAMGGDLIPYDDIPGCRPYLPVFERRVAKPLLSAFGFARDAFSDAGTGLGGSAETYGDSSFTLYPFPRVPITFVLWEGDQDFPPSIKTLFDPTIHTYLPLEDITVISKMAATRILKQARLEEMDME